MSDRLVKRPREEAARYHQFFFLSFLSLLLLLFFVRLQYQLIPENMMPRTDTFKIDTKRWKLNMFTIGKFCATIKSYDYSPSPWEIIGIAGAACIFWVTPKR
jgi:hypothetical protein